MGNTNPARKNIADVYRRFTRDGQSRREPNLDALLALADGERSPQSERALGEVERSGMHADLLRFARALTPESARLGVALEQAFDADRSAHRLDRRMGVRHSAPARRGWLRVAASVVAGLTVAVAVWSLQQHRAEPLAPTTAQTPASQATGDRIFAAIENAPRGQKSDEIFRGEFNRDRIFNAGG